MAFDHTEDFNIELTDADLDEINGGLKLGDPFPFGIVDPEFWKRQLETQIPIFSKGIPNPIQNLKDTGLNRF